MTYRGKPGERGVDTTGSLIEPEPPPNPTLWQCARWLGGCLTAMGLGLPESDGRIRVEARETRDGIELRYAPPQPVRYDREAAMRSVDVSEALARVDWWGRPVALRFIFGHGTVTLCWPEEVGPRGNDEPRNWNPYG